jgi:hypothetical protein
MCGRGTCRAAGKEATLKSCRNNLWRFIPLAILITGLLLVPLPGRGETYMPQAVIGCGAVAAGGGSQQLSGTVGQPLAGMVDAEGSYEIRGGFWFSTRLWCTGVPPLPLPIQFSLLPPRPNPTCDRAAVEYAIPVPCHVGVHLYDVAGRRVHTLIDQLQPPGYYTAWVNGASLSAGIYFVRLRAGMHQETVRLVVAK